jgi:hypothetical protein
MRSAARATASCISINFLHFSPPRRRTHTGTPGNDSATAGTRLAVRPVRVAMATRRCTRFSRTALAAGAAAVLVLLSGCSGSNDESAGSDDAGSASVERAEGGDAAGAPVAEDAGGSSAGGNASQVDAPEGGAPGVEPQKVISTGNVQLRSGDVGQAIFDVRKVVDVHGGTIAEDDTETDKDGGALRSRMVLRIPTAAFDDAMTELEQVGTLVSSKRQTADVTTQVLDIDVRVEAQQRSIDRIQVLFDNAQTIKDVVSVESELSRRQADLASLQAQQRYLADQTSMSTITLSVERTPEKAEPKPDTDDAGFLTGLSGGWKALKGFLVALATVAGALLPWVALGLVLAVPSWPLVRRLRRRAGALAEARPSL